MPRRIPGAFHKMFRPYRGAVALVLSVTALFKFIAVARHERLLLEPDALTGMPMFWLAVAAGVLEIVVAVFVLSCPRPKPVLVVVHLCALGFVGYHAAVTATG